MEIILKYLGKQSEFHIGELSEIAAARRAGTELAKELSFDDTRAGQLALIITEAATNIAKHAEAGNILLRPVFNLMAKGVEVIAIDAGPGITNLSIQMADGHSTTGTYGVGLGSMQRLAHEFHIYTEPNKGTVIAMTLWDNPSAVIEQNWLIGAICIAIPGETECGDSWLAEPWADGISVTVADGLGHGPNAAKASLIAVTTLKENPNTSPNQFLQRCHMLMQGSRGSAVAVAIIDTHLNRLRFAGIGNIASCIYEINVRRHLISLNGIVGNNIRKVQEFEQPWKSDSVMVMHSDGIGTRWDLDQYPGLLMRHPTLIAAVIYRDFSRGRDDSTILIIRQTTGI